MNLPDLSSRLVQAPVIGFLICERALTAPLRWLSPTVLFFAICLFALVLNEHQLWGGSCSNARPLGTAASGAKPIITH
jgi:hypothetical protein